MVIKKLANERKHRGGSVYTHYLKLIDRIDNIAIYGRAITRADFDKGRLFNYEVIRIRVKRVVEKWMTEYTHLEIYPNSSSWGRDGFTYANLDSARAKMARLLTQERIKQHDRID